MSEEARRSPASIEPRIQYVEVKATGGQGGRFSRFRGWIRRVFGSASEIEKDATALAEAIKAAGLENLRQPALLNAEREAEIQRKLADSQSTGLASTMEVALFDEKRELLRQQARLTAAEARKAESDATRAELEANADALRIYKDLGFTVVPIIADGRLEALYVKKGPPERALISAEPDALDSSE